MGKKKIYLLWGIMVLIIMIAGSYAYFLWMTSEARLVLTVGDIDNIQVVLKPYKIDTELLPVLTYDNEEYINIEVVNNSSTGKKFELYYQINKIDEELKNENFKYTITKSTDGGNTYTEIKTDTFSSAIENTTITVYSDTISSKTTEKYRAYIWLDGSNDGQTNVVGKSFNAELRANIYKIETPSTSEANAPVLDEGMIPIVFDTSNGTIVKTISSDDSSWYDYDNQLWANAALVTSSSRSNYLGTTGVTVSEDDILAYFVWIPRYSYKIWSVDNSEKTGQEQTIEIQFESPSTISTGTGVGEYITHPAFWWDNNSNGVRETGEELSGIWVGKFETTGTGDNPTIKPDVSSLISQNVSTQFSTAQKFGTSTYGITSNTDAHMMKNSDWGSVVYLAHSKYGVNREIYFNNSRENLTGRSGGNVPGSTQINAIYSDQTSTKQFNAYGFYTWDGYLLNYNTNTKSTTRDLTKVASTTGNITGVYDMSGGTIENVMGYYYSNSHKKWGKYAGFTSKLDSKYYDNYTD